MDYRQLNNGFTHLAPLLLVLAQSLSPVEPAEGALDNPALGLHLEARRRCALTEGHLDPEQSPTPVA